MNSDSVSLLARASTFSFYSIPLCPEPEIKLCCEYPGICGCLTNSKTDSSRLCQNSGLKDLLGKYCYSSTLTISAWNIVVKVSRFIDMMTLVLLFFNFCAVLRAGSHHLSLGRERCHPCFIRLEDAKGLLFFLTHNFCLLTVLYYIGY